MTKEELEQLLRAQGLNGNGIELFMQKHGYGRSDVGTFGSEDTYRFTPEEVRRLVEGMGPELASGSGLEQEEAADRARRGTQPGASRDEQQAAAEVAAAAGDEELLGQIQEQVGAQSQADVEVTTVLRQMAGGQTVDMNDVIANLREMAPHLGAIENSGDLLIHLMDDRTKALVQAAVAASTEGQIGGWIPVQIGVRVTGPFGDRKYEPIFHHIRSDEYVEAVTRYPALSDQIGRAVAEGRKTGIDWRVLIAVADSEGAAGDSTRPRKRTALSSLDEGVGNAKDAIAKVVGSLFGAPKTKSGAQTEFGSADAADRWTEDPTLRSMRLLNMELAEKARMFNGSIELALLARKDEGLARAIFERGYASVSEADRASQLMGREFEDLLESGAPLSQAKIGAILGSDPYGGAGGGGGVSVTLPDPAAVKESVTGLFRAWFQRDPVEGEAESFLGIVNSAIMGEARSRSRAGSPGNIFKGVDPVDGETGVASVTDVDPQARLMEFARSQPDYQRLFSNRPQGMDEEQYAGQFQQAASSFLGPQAPPSASIRAGMETGSIQTTLGAAMASDVARESSTLLGRLARVSQLVNGMT